MKSRIIPKSGSSAYLRDRRRSRHVMRNLMRSFSLAYSRQSEPFAQRPFHTQASQHQRIEVAAVPQAGLDKPR